jgi:nucleoid-associated protein YgaU
LVLCAVAGTITWCPNAVAQSYDLQSGQYLTAEEYKKLSGDEAIEYCQRLAQEIDIQNDNAAAANSMMSDLDDEIAALRAELAVARSANDPLSSRVADLERQIRELQEMPQSYTVVKDDFLIKIASKGRLYSDEKGWKRIYRGNRGDIADPNLIFPDQVFMIPRGLPTSHVVEPGETLRIIAGYWEVYGDRNQSGRIYEANRDKITDPNVIHPGLVLTIPR